MKVDIVMKGLVKYYEWFRKGEWLYDGMKGKVG